MPELYTAYLGMRARQRTLEVIANNIANASTTGFKADGLLYSSVEAAENEKLGVEHAAGSEHSTTSGASALAASGAPAGGASSAAVVLGVTVSGTTNFSAGPVRQTGRALDVALSGEGFLVVRTPRGERYSRAGSLTLDAAGQLVTQGGDIVVGQNGPVTVPPGEVSIGEDGTITAAGGRAVDRLKVVRFADPRAALVKEGGSLFAATAGTRPADDSKTRVVSGALESSNVSTIEEVAAMIQNNREFESLNRMMTLKLKGEDEIGRI